MVSGHPYGIHGMLEEHFGMAVAEDGSEAAAWLSFTRGRGGEVEIVGDELT